MKLDDYQSKASVFAQYEDIGNPLVYPALGLAGEAGEVVEKVKKLCRNHAGVINEERRLDILKELGDVLWYVSEMARRLEWPLSEVAAMNLDKLTSRQERGVINSQGDNR